MRNKLVSGAFHSALADQAEAFNASVAFDKRLYAVDIEASVAHVTMLAHCEIITATEREAIVAGLQQIRAEIEGGSFHWQSCLEDVHMNIEARLIELIGESGKKLHTARSRNDQVATDLRLWLRQHNQQLCCLLRRLQHGLVNKAERHAATIMPGMTHLQPAQPVTFGHHLLAWHEMLSRDSERFAACHTRINRLPLGAAALAGTSYPIDRAMTARLLGFDGVCHNALDAVSDRDFVIEFCCCAAMLMNHLSRMCEEIVLWNATQFGFITLGDDYSTGSSIMPQKRNPDIAELIRGKCARVSGALSALLMLMKAQPLAYNKDNQEDKEPLFDVVDTCSSSVALFTGMLDSLKVQKDNMRRAAKLGYTTATDLADYLSRKNIPFREAHHIVGQCVQHARWKECELAALSLQELRSFCGEIEEDVFAVLDIDQSVRTRDHIGGTAPDRVRARCAEIRLSLPD